MRRLAGVGAGVVCLILGAITGPTPLPFGIVFLALGAFLLARESVVARRGIRWLRYRLPALDHGLGHIAQRLPRAVRVVIHRTAPIASRRRWRLGAGTRGRVAAAPVGTPGPSG
ncbi:hypothetical protein [Roseospira goensis]|uniref:Transmembrane protein (PGPGW) n=1 Tax=Roseospira goensis TaxID=391922 RepID=A0A7W6RZQ1_9PROT|nr:hypothetical protein [Roseospira goensis]MBB4286208.1 hypothetical protein [Roseospira goensis]